LLAFHLRPRLGCFLGSHFSSSVGWTAGIDLRKRERATSSYYRYYVDMG
jgi:hypothetical protein